MAISTFGFPTVSQGWSAGADFSPLANLGNVAREAQNRATLEQVGKGLASGQLDYTKAAGMLASLGDLNPTLGMLKLAEERRKQDLQAAAAASFGRKLSGMYGGDTESTPPVAAPPPPSVGPSAGVPPTEADMAGGAPAPQAPAPPSQAMARAPSDAAQRVSTLIQAASSEYLPQATRETARALLGDALKDMHPTERIQTLQALKDSDPAHANKSLLQIEQELKQPTVVMQQEGAQAKALGEKFGDIRGKIMDAGMKAPKTLATLDVMERASKDPNFYSGTGGEAATAIKRGMSAIGFADAGSAAPNEVFSKMSNQLTSEVLSGDKGGAGLGAGISNADRDFMNKTVPNLQNTPEGNKVLIDIHRATAERDKVIAKMARDYAKAHGGNIDDAFLQQVSDYQEANPMFANINIPSGALKSASETTAPAVTGTHQNIKFKFEP